MSVVYGVPIPLPTPVTVTPPGGVPKTYDAITYGAPSGGSTAFYQIARVLSASGATPVVVTTDVTLPNGQFRISGAVGNTALNGDLVFSPLGGNSYALYTATPGGLVALAPNGTYAGGAIISIAAVTGGGGGVANLSRLDGT